MKKYIAAALTAGLVFGTVSTVFAGGAFEGKQTASAYLDQNTDTNEVKVYVDLSDGWSAQFAEGAVYLYDGPADENKDATAIGLTLEREVYDEYIAGAEEKEGYRSEDGITAFLDEDGTQYYAFNVDEGYAYFLVDVNKEADGNAVVSRFAIRKPDDGHDDAEDFEISELYTNEDLNAARDAILNEFGKWTGCECESLEYAGDDVDTAEDLAFANEGNEGAPFTQCIKFLMNFHSPVEEADLEGTTWEPDTDYQDYEWILARTDGGDWEIVNFGY